ncbi:MAG: DUF7408 domain-containing protein [Nanoarchaeota archaeon]
MVFGIEKLLEYLPDFIREIEYMPYFDNLKYAFYSILILIFLHLMRPKPNDKTVPSIMFFIKEGGKSKRNAFLQRFMNNLLFFLQLLVLILLCFSLLEPFIMVNREVGSKNTILVLDISASMDSSDSFEKLKKNALENLNGEISIILVAENPMVVLEKGTINEAKKIIDLLSVKPFGSAIGESIRTASSILGGDDGKIIVISDFLNNVGPSVLIEKEKAESKGQVVSFLNVYSPQKNIGIINVKIERPDSIAYIKNFNFEDEKVNIEINGQKSEIVIPKRSIVPINFRLEAGVNKLSIDVADDIDFDDVVYISTPREREVSVLLLTNDKDSYLETALKSNPNIKLDVAIPPIVNELNHKVYVIDKIDENKVLPGTIKTIIEQVKKGSSVITIYDPKMQSLDKIMPVYQGNFNSDNISLTIELQNKLTKDIAFGKTQGYYEVIPKNDYVDIAKADNYSVLGYLPEGEGKIFHYGINENDNFLLSPSYPIFWNNLINYLVNSKSIDYYNYITGSMMSVPKDSTLVSPSGNKMDDIVLYDEVGLYNVEKTDIYFASNFLNEQESDIFLESDTEKKIKSDDLSFEKRKVEQNLVIYALGIAILLLLIELLYIKYRGDI